MVRRRVSVRAFALRYLRALVDGRAFSTFVQIRYISRVIKLYVLEPFSHNRGGSGCVWYVSLPFEPTNGSTIEALHLPALIDSMRRANLFVINARSPKALYRMARQFTRGDTIIVNGLAALRSKALRDFVRLTRALHSSHHLLRLHEGPQLLSCTQNPSIRHVQALHMDVIAVTDELRSAYLDLDLSCTRVISEPPILRRPIPRESVPPIALRGSQMPLVCLIVSSVQSRKGLSRILALAAAAEESGSPIRFVWAGRPIGPDARVVASSSLSTASFVGPLTSSWLEMVSDLADCMVLASHEDPMPLAVTEFLSWRKPVFVSLEAGINPILQDFVSRIDFDRGVTVLQEIMGSPLVRHDSEKLKRSLELSALEYRHAWREVVLSIESER